MRRQEAVHLPCEEAVHLVEAAAHLVTGWRSAWRAAVRASLGAPSTGSLAAPSAEATLGKLAQ